MLDNCQSALERWGGVNTIVDRWLLERKQVLVKFCTLTDADRDEQTQARTVQELCQLMVDYVSAGHFEVYDQLIKEARDFNDDEGLHKAAELYKTVDSTTEHLLDFNDKYQETDDLSTLVRDLSALGEQMETRFEAEDQMISVLHTAHKALVV